jgi:cysteine desulfurase
MRIGTRLYCDHAATTPVSPRAAEAMEPWLREKFHNPSSLYEGARAARQAIDEARDLIANAMRCLPGEIVFVSSGTEAANLAIFGAAAGCANRKRFLFSAGEHECVLNCEPRLISLGFSVETVPLTSGGQMDLNALSDAMSDDVCMVAAMSANNETGALNDVSAIAQICQKFGALYFCDAVQSFGLLPLNVTPDATAISAHKIYGPKGIAALRIRAGAAIKPILFGGGQEREMRAGTENVAGIVGFAEAVKETMEDAGRAGRVQSVRDAFVQALRIEGVEWTVKNSLPGHAHFTIRGASSEAMLINLDRLGVDASSGSACSSGSIEPSHVLIAMGMSEAQAKSALRFSFGAHSQFEDAIEAAERTKQAASLITRRIG